MITEAIYHVLLLIDLLLILGSFWLGPKLVRAYRIALLATAIGLGLMFYALVGLLTAPIPGYLLGVKVLIVAIVPLLLEFLILLWIYRKRFNAR